MGIKVALALNADGTRLEHFGQADRFGIYELGPSAPVERELRHASAFCRQDDKDNKLETVADLLADCRAVVCAAIGPCARLELSDAGVEAFEYDGATGDAVGAIARQSFVARLERQTTLSKEPTK
jgi:predicted Fe-Mo cluster-binding NifX family protein